MLDFIKKQEKTLGVSRKKRRYDLPLNNDAGTGFLKLLILLMTILAMLALAASFTLSEMTDRWSSGLENKITIEIPAEDADGNLLERSNVKESTQKISKILENHPAVEEMQVMDEDDIRDLVSPWLGEDLAMNSIPVPGIISVSLQQGAEIDLERLEERLRQIAPSARIDTHENWLSSVLRFTGALQFAAALLTLVIGITTIVAVAGAAQSRLAVHKDELELLHLMGATDEYITRQLQRHTLFLSLQAALVGTLIGAAILLLIDWISGEMGVALLPDYTLSIFQKIMLTAIPVLISVIAMLTARFTVLRALAQMP